MKPCIAGLTKDEAWKKGFDLNLEVKISVLEKKPCKVARKSKVLDQNDI